jgi:hypothetical protein
MANLQNGSGEPLKCNKAKALLMTVPIEQWRIRGSQVVRVNRRGPRKVLASQHLLSVNGRLDLES